MDSVNSDARTKQMVDSFLSQRDAILERNAVTKIKSVAAATAASDGSWDEEFKEKLVQNYSGYPSLSLILFDWLGNAEAMLKASKSATATSSSSATYNSVSATAGAETEHRATSLLTDIIRQKFDKRKADALFLAFPSSFDGGASSPVWLEKFLSERIFRKTIIDLYKTNATSKFLAHCIRKISSLGHSEELGQAINYTDHFSVFCDMLTSLIVNTLRAADDAEELPSSIKKLVALCTTSDFACYYAADLLRGLQGYFLDIAAGLESETVFVSAAGSGARRIWQQQQEALAARVELSTKRKRIVTDEDDYDADDGINGSADSSRVKSAAGGEGGQGVKQLWEANRAEVLRLHCLKAAVVVKNCLQQLHVSVVSTLNNSSSFGSITAAGGGPGSSMSGASVSAIKKSVAAAMDFTKPFEYSSSSLSTTSSSSSSSTTIAETLKDVERCSDLSAEHIDALYGEIFPSTSDGGRLQASCAHLLRKPEILQIFLSYLVKRESVAVANAVQQQEQQQQSPYPDPSAGLSIVQKAVDLLSFAATFQENNGTGSNLLLCNRILLLAGSASSCSGGGPSADSVAATAVQPELEMRNRLLEAMKCCDKLNEMVYGVVVYEVPYDLLEQMKRHSLISALVLRWVGSTSSAYLKQADNLDTFLTSLMPILLQFIVAAALQYPLQRPSAFENLKTLMACNVAAAQLAAEDATSIQTERITSSKRDVIEAMVFLIRLGYQCEPVLYMIENGTKGNYDAAMTRYILHLLAGSIQRPIAAPFAKKLAQLVSSDSAHRAVGSQYFLKDDAVALAGHLSTISVNTSSSGNGSNEAENAGEDDRTINSADVDLLAKFIRSCNERAVKP